MLLCRLIYLFDHHRVNITNYNKIKAARKKTCVVFVEFEKKKQNKSHAKKQQQRVASETRGQYNRFVRASNSARIGDPRPSPWPRPNRQRQRRRPVNERPWSKHGRRPRPTPVDCLMSFRDQPTKGYLKKERPKSGNTNKNKKLICYHLQ